MRTLRLIVLFFFFLVPFITTAAELGIKMRDGSHFLLQLDNSFFNKPETVYNLINVTEGYHYLQVYRVSRNGNTDLAFKGYVYVPGNSLVRAIVENDRRIKVTTEYVQSSNIIPAPGPNNSGSGSYSPGYSGTSVSAPVAMNDSEFESIRASVANTSFSSTKLSTAKNALNGRYLTSKQVAQLLKEFVFESDKIELAKYCYDITLDKGNYYLINDSFSFASSIEEMNKFLESKK